MPQPDPVPVQEPVQENSAFEEEEKQPLEEVIEEVKIAEPAKED